MKETPRIVITGFMGAGKTTVAGELARVLSCDALDLDEFILAREGRSPRALIDEEGEAAFREIESRALRAALETEGARVLALGGGTWAFERNREALAEHGCVVVWLDAPFELCWQRVEADKAFEGRPLAREQASASALYEERLAAYGLARLRVAVNGAQSAGELAAQIVAALSQAETGGRSLLP
jgi:shikimate kinase